MKIKILIFVLMIAIIVFGVLLGIKFVDSKNSNDIKNNILGLNKEKEEPTPTPEPPKSK